MATKNTPAPKNGHKHNSHGGWIPKVTKSVIHLCPTCKTKYIKTRDGQVACIKCIYSRAPQSFARLKKG